MKKSFKVICILIFCMFLLSGCEKQKPVEEETEIVEELFQNETVDFIDIGYSESGDNFYIVQKSMYTPEIQPDKYRLKVKVSGSTKMWKGGRSIDLDSYTVQVQDIKTGDEIKVVDIKLLLEPYWDNYQISSMSGGSLLWQDGKYYFCMGVYTIPNIQEKRGERKTESINLLIDLETEEIIVSEEPVSFGTGDNSNIWVMIGTLFLDINGFESTLAENVALGESISCIRIPTKCLPEKNEKLYTLFPGLQNVSKEEGVYAFLYLTPQTTDLEVMALLFSEDQEVIFDGLEEEPEGYVGFCTINGKRHNITQEEYEEFQKEYYAYKEIADQGEGDSLLPERN